MKLAISQRAFELKLEPVLLPQLKAQGISAIEVAIGRLPGGVNTSNEDLNRFRQHYLSAGFTFCAIQSIFFGAGPVKAFGTKNEQLAYKNHLLKVAQVCHGLGIPTIVLGGYQQRMRVGLHYQEAMAKFATLLTQVASKLPDTVALAIEAVPASYGADFLTNHTEVANLVDLVNHPAVGLHLDLGAYHTNQEPIAELTMFAKRAKHCHLAVPDFGLIHTSNVPIKHSEYAQELMSVKAIPYLSVEMFEHASDAGVQPIIETLSFIRQQYHECLE